MRRLLPLLFALALLAPVSALAADAAIALDFTSGPLAAWMGRTLGLAR